MKPGHVLMVCLGNICRSPLAQGVFEQLSPYPNYRVDSAGTANYHRGAPPDPRSITTAQQHGIAIDHQRARHFNPQDFQDFDYIYVMDKQNLENVLALAKNENERKKVHLLLGDTEVEDPYYGGDEGFEQVYQKIHQACLKILSKWTP